MLKTRKIPMRTCIGCHEIRPKKELIRIVKDSEGNLSVDRTGKKAGRGAYLCDDPQCLDKALAAHGLEKAFSMAVAPEVQQALKEELAGGR